VPRTINPALALKRGGSRAAVETWPGDRHNQLRRVQHTCCGEIAKSNLPNIVRELMKFTWKIDGNASLPTVHTGLMVVPLTAVSRHAIQFAGSHHRDVEKLRQDNRPCEKP